MSKRFVFLFTVLLLKAPVSLAQNYELQETKNEVKLNLLSLAVKTASFQYERNLRPHLTAALGLRFTPESELPFKSQLGVSSGNVESNNVVVQALDATRLRSFAVTPEVRYYFRADGTAQGIYAAVVGRYSNNSLSSSFVTRSNSSSTGYRNIVAEGNYAGVSMGMMLGAKFMLSKRLSLDCWIAGPMYASGKMKLDADMNMEAMSQDERSDIQKDAARGAFIGPIKVKPGTVAFRDNGFTLRAPVNIVEFRTGLAIGFRF